MILVVCMNVDAGQSRHRVSVLRDPVYCKFSVRIYILFERLSKDRIHLLSTFAHLVTGKKVHSATVNT